MIDVYRKRCIAFATINLLLLTSIIAQPNFQLTHYTDADGLPQNSVKFIMSDNAGYIWLSTEDGLVRFDGYHFRTYGKKELKTSSNRIQAFYSLNKALYCYTANYEPIKLKNGAAGLSGAPSGWLAAQINLTIRPKGIFKENFQEAARYLDDGSINLNYAKKRQFKELFILNKEDSLFRYDNTHISLYYKNKLIRSLPYDTDQDWDFFLLNSKLYSLEKNGTVAKLSTEVVKTKLKGDILNSISLKNKNTEIKLLWNICVENQVILFVDNSFFLATMDGDGQITTKLLFKGFDASSENICSAYYNNQSGILFLGSSTKGLFVLTPKLFKTISAEDGENIFGSQVEYQPNKILSTGNWSFDLSTTALRIESKQQSTPIDFISIAKDRLSGNLWAFHRRWLYLISATTLKKLADWQLPNSINAIYQDEMDKLWVGTISGKLYVKSQSDSIPTLYKSLSDRITYILRTDRFNLYVGTVSGLYQLNLKNKKSIRINNLEDKSIRNIFKSSSGEIWVATYGDGFYLVDQGRAIGLPLDKEKYLRTPHYFIEDSLGFLWIPTNKGLFQVAKNDLLTYINNRNTHAEGPFYYYYDKNNGFKTNEFNGGCEPCAIKVSNGLQSMPSMNGLVLFNPDSIKSLLPGAALYIDKITLDSLEVDTKDLKELSEDFIQLNIGVSTPFLGNHKNLQITYALTERGAKDTIFFPIGDNSEISVSRLPHGQYTLIIRKTNGFGIGNYSELKLSIIVQPKWFHSPWFGIFLIFLFPFLGIIASNVRSKYVVRRNRDLEKRIEEKTTHLRKRVNMQELIIRAIGHDIRTPLKYHIILSENIKKLSEEGDGQLAKKTAILNDSSQQLFQLVENFVQYLKAQNNTSIEKTQNVILNTILDKKLSFFKDITKRNRTVLLNICTTDVVVNSDPQLLAIIIHNIIDNATKVIKDGIITTQIGISKQKRPFLTIADSGPGLNPQILKWINKPDSDQSNADTMPINCGLGLMMVKQLSHLLKIQITASSEIGSGTTFTLLF